ncbi:MAG: 16S rRNA (uracil(1498)-N(3))-methyltransferase [Acidobacteria bacterium]|nr:16S rRNA (uracil(1498)-N(3))-methyltransferase [Acidobacteriota bacterium]
MVGKKAQASRRFFIPPELICDKETRLPDAEARHLKNVLRIREGERVEIFDGKGVSWSGAVEFRRGAVFVCELTPTHSRHQPAAARLALALATIKPARFEWALEKATELGVDEFIPLYTARSEIRVSSEKISGRLARWDRITKEASKQCMRLDVPRVLPPLEFRGFLSSEEYSIQNKILFYEKSDDPWPADRTETAGNTIICIGPEGGWTEDEIGFAKESGCVIFSLGPRVLRAETAAIAAVSVWLIRGYREKK